MPGIVLHPMKAVYWPVYKAASTLLKRHFARTLGLGEFPGVTVHDAPFPMTDNIISEYSNFAIIRNPFTRLYALWCHKIQVPNTEIDVNVFGGIEQFFYTGMPFSDFVIVLLSQRIRLDPHWAPLVTQMPMDCIIYKLEESILPFLFLKVNTKSVGNWQDAYTEMAKEIALDFYKEDLKRFNYAFM